MDGLEGLWSYFPYLFMVGVMALILFGWWRLRRLVGGSTFPWSKVGKEGDHVGRQIDQQAGVHI